MKKKNIKLKIYETFATKQFFIGIVKFNILMQILDLLYLHVDSNLSVSREISSNFHLSIPTTIFDVQGSISRYVWKLLPKTELDIQHSTPEQ